VALAEAATAVLKAALAMARLVHCVTVRAGFWARLDNISSERTLSRITFRP
jgi:hypothetical protein